jgi:hypothetical protein
MAMRSMKPENECGKIDIHIYIRCIQICPSKCLGSCHNSSFKGLALTNPEKSSGFLSSGVERVTSTSDDEVVSSILAESTFILHQVTSENIVWLSLCQFLKIWLSFVYAKICQDCGLGTLSWHSI